VCGHALTVAIGKGGEMDDAITFPRWVGFAPADPSADLIYSSLGEYNPQLLLSQTSFVLVDNLQYTMHVN